MKAWTTNAHSRPLPIGRGSALAVALLILLGCGAAQSADSQESPDVAPDGPVAKATFAGGCFWCMEPPFDEIDGVYSTTSGYTGGPEKDPDYQQVSSGRTGHAEAVEILYDPEKVSYAELLEVFWVNIDPTTADAQFCDRGRQYRTAIFFHDAEQERLAREAKQRIEESDRLDGPIVTEIVAAGEFYPAEEYHQDYYLKNPVRYKLYRSGCGRDRTLERIWGAAPH